MSPVPDTESECDDKPTESEDLSTPDLIIPLDPDSAEEDEEDHNSAYLGYQPLSQDPADSNRSDSEESVQSDDNDTTGINGVIEETGVAAGVPLGNMYPDFPHGNLPPYMQVPDIDKSGKKCLLWNQTRKETEMGQEQVAKVKAAMTGFQLPMSNIPDWAKNMTDEEWKRQLSKINADRLNHGAQGMHSSTEKHDADAPHCSKNS